MSGTYEPASVLQWNLGDEFALNDESVSEFKRTIRKTIPSQWQDRLLNEVVASLQRYYVRKLHPMDMEYLKDVCAQISETGSAFIMALERLGLLSEPAKLAFADNYSDHSKLDPFLTDSLSAVFQVKMAAYEMRATANRTRAAVTKSHRTPDYYLKTLLDDLAALWVYAGGATKGRYVEAFDSYMQSAVNLMPDTSIPSLEEDRLKTQIRPKIRKMGANPLTERWG